MSSQCLIEVGTEELPPRALRTLAQDFARLVQQGLVDVELGPDAVEVFATPRRLAMLLKDLCVTTNRPRDRKTWPGARCRFRCGG